MNKRDVTYFPSKILLFGEYTVTMGGTAVAMSYERFFGKWKFDQFGDNDSLHNLAAYLNEIDWVKYKSKFHFERFIKDLDNGLYFDSNIKTGFGVGSSGALCAGIFDRFFQTADLSVQNLNQLLAKIESYFHGVSSGIDPLVSLLNRTVKIDKTELEVYNKNMSQFKHFNLYLLDSNVSRSTKQYINIFKEKMNSCKYANQILKPLIDLNNRIVYEFMENNEFAVFELFSEISDLQYKGFSEMILPGILPLWHNILTQNDISIKLCGAGGGGYYLLMAKKEMDISKFIVDYQVLSI